MRSVNNEWLTLAILLTLLFIFIGLAEKLRSYYKWSPEVTRKFVHIFTGVLIFFTPCWFTSALPLKALAVLFIILNFIAIKLNFFTGMHGTERATYGTVYYPLSFFILLQFFWPNYTIIVQLSMLILTLADALAAIVGEQLKQPHTYSLTGDRKSLEGSAVMAFTTFLIVAVGLWILQPSAQISLNTVETGWIALITAIVVMVAEALSVAGSDNLSAPLSAAFVLHFMLTHNYSQNLVFSTGFILALLIGLISLKLHFLNRSGAAATFLLGTLIFGIGGWIWGIPILTFFISSSILSKLWQNRKKSSNLFYEKSSKRDYEQVLANGGIPASAILIYYVSGEMIFFLVYLASLAAVTADTWATEIGALSKSKPRLITTFKLAEPGTSGAVSVIGTLGTLSGSFLIGFTGYLIQPAFFTNGFTDLILITIAGFIASLVDSLLGATIQAQYRCTACQKITEKKIHCSQTSNFFRGMAWVNNDVVNGFCALTGFLIIYLIYL